MTYRIRKTPAAIYLTTAATNPAMTLPGPLEGKWKRWGNKRLRRHGAEAAAVPINEGAQDRPDEEIEKKMHLANEFEEQ